MLPDINVYRTFQWIHWNQSTYEWHLDVKILNNNNIKFYWRQVTTNCSVMINDFLAWESFIHNVPVTEQHFNEEQVYIDVLLNHLTLAYYKHTHTHIVSLSINKIQSLSNLVKFFGSMLYNTKSLLLYPYIECSKRVKKSGKDIELNFITHTRIYLHVLT